MAPFVRGALCAFFALAVGLPAIAAERSVAPVFKAKSVTGETLDLEKLLARGPVLLDFWATWCKPCLEALPEVEALHERHAPRGLTVIGISIDGPRNFSKVRPFARRLGLTYALVLDRDGALQRRYHVRAVPTTILVAPDGTIARSMLGYRPGEIESLERAILELLGPGEDAPEDAGER